MTNGLTQSQRERHHLILRKNILEKITTSAPFLPKGADLFFFLIETKTEI